MNALSTANALAPVLFAQVPGLFTALTLALGAVMGSFLTCAAWRAPRGESLWAPPSHCPHCGATLGVADLVPILSWVAARGRCRHCGTAVSARYPLIELATVALSVGLGALTGANLYYFGGLPVVGLWVFVALVGLEHKRLALKTLAVAVATSALWGWALL